MSSACDASASSVSIQTALMMILRLFLVPTCVLLQRHGLTLLGDTGVNSELVADSRP